MWLTISAVLWWMWKTFWGTVAGVYLACMTIGVYCIVRDTIRERREAKLAEARLSSLAAQQQADTIERLLNAALERTSEPEVTEPEGNEVCQSVKGLPFQIRRNSTRTRHYVQRCEQD